MLLAGVLLKMGGYALIRFNVQMLPEAHLQLAPALMVLGIVNVVWGHSMLSPRTTSNASPAAP